MPSKPEDRGASIIDAVVDMNARIAQLESAIVAIWDAYKIVNSNGGTGWMRHVTPTIYEAIRLVPVEKRGGRIG